LVKIIPKYIQQKMEVIKAVCSPILFNIMMDDIFKQVEHNVGKSLYADHGALWIRGRNISYLNKTIQAAR